MNKNITKRIQKIIDEYKENGFTVRAEYYFNDNIESFVQQHAIYVLFIKDTVEQYLAVGVDSKEQAEEIIKELNI